MKHKCAVILGASVCYSIAAGAQDLRISGHVASADGLPLSEAFVNLDSLKLISRVDSSGRYELTVPDSVVRGQLEKLVAFAKGHVLTKAAVTLSGATLVHDFVLRVDTMPEHRRRFPILSDGRTPKSATDVTITGRVVDDSGVAVPNASLRLEGTGFAAVTDDSGRYTLSIPARAAETTTTFVVVRMDYSPTRVSAARADTPATRTFVMSKPIYSDTAAPLDTRIARAAGLSDLQRGPHRTGEREIRIRIDGGYFTNILYRFWNRAGVAGGEVIRFVSPRDDDDSLPGASATPRRHSCKNASDEVFPCRVKFSHEPEWSRLWKSLDSLDVWHIVDEGTLNKPWTMVLDGTTTTAELWNGREYDAWAYPVGVEDLESGHAKVNAVSTLLQDIDSLMSP